MRAINRNHTGLHPVDQQSEHSRVASEKEKKAADKAEDKADKAEDREERKDGKL